MPRPPTALMGCAAEKGSEFLNDTRPTLLASTLCHIAMPSSWRLVELY